MKTEGWFDKLQEALTSAMKPIKLSSSDFAARFGQEHTATFILETDEDPNAAPALRRNFLAEAQTDDTPFTITPPQWSPTLREVRQPNGEIALEQIPDTKVFGKKVRSDSQAARRIRGEHDRRRVQALTEAKAELEEILRPDSVDASKDDYLKSYGINRLPGRRDLADTIYHGTKKALLQSRNGQMPETTEKDVREALKDIPDVQMIRAASFLNPNVVTNLIRKALRENRQADELQARIIGEE